MYDRPAALVQTCLAAHGHNCQAWDHPIDPLVARLYGLENEEIAIVNNTTK